MTSIRNKILKRTVLITGASLLCCTFVSFRVLQNIKISSYHTAKESGNIAAESSAEALISQNTAYAAEYVQCCSETVYLKISAVISALNSVNGEIRTIYEYPDNYPPHKYKHPSEYPPGTLSMQWVLPDNTEMNGSVENEVYLLGNTEPAFASVLNVYGEMLDIYFTSGTGINIGYDSYPQTKPETYDGRLSAWYKHTEETGGIYISAPYSDTFGRGLMITAALPCIGENGTFYGAVGADILITDLNEFISGISMGRDSRALIISPQGVICAKGLTMDNAGDFNAFFGENGSKTVKRIYKDDNGFFKTDINGKDVYCVYSRTGISDWTTVLIVSENEITAPSEALKKTIYASADSLAERLNGQMLNATVLWGVIIAAVMIFTVIITDRVSLSLSRPITQLCGAIEKIGGGDLDCKCRIKTGDEIETLSDSFEKMTVSLKTYMENYADIAAEKQRISTELNVAARIQTSALPCVFPDRTDFSIYAKMYPAKEVGGDFYDFCMIGENKVGIIMADVSGKGVPAALFMMTAKSLIKNLALEGLPVNEIFEKANAQLSENNDSLMFVTAFMAIIDLNTGVAEFANAGHNPPAIRRKDGVFKFPEIKSDRVLAALPGMKYQKQTVNLDSGDILFAYTDGVTEAMNTQKDFYGEDRLLRTLNKAENKGGTETNGIIEAVKKDIELFAEGAEPADDITMLAFKIM